MRRICVDMDEVMADTLAEHLRRYNETFDEAVKADDLAGRALWDIAPLERQQQLRAFLDAEDFFEDLPLMADSQQVLKELSARFEIFIATQAMVVPNSLGPKFRWLQRHFPFILPSHYVFCGDKSILRANYLIDDQPKNLIGFKGQGLLFTAPHNTSTNTSAKTRRSFFPRGCIVDARSFSISVSQRKSRWGAMSCAVRRIL